MSEPRGMMSASMGGPMRAHRLAAARTGGGLRPAEPPRATEILR